MRALTTTDNTVTTTANRPSPSKDAQSSAPRMTVQIVQHLRPGGIETLALDLLTSPPGGGEGRIVSLEGTAEDAIAAWPRLADVSDRLIFLNKRPGLDLGLIWRLRGILRRLDASAVHTHHVGPLLYGGASARLARIPALVHTEHDAWHLEDPKRATLVRRLVRLIQPTVCADAQLVAHVYERHIGRSVDAVVRNGIDLGRFSPQDRGACRTALDLPLDAVVFGTAGRMVPVKDHKTLLNAFARLNHPWAILALAGDGPERADLEAQVKAMGLTDRVRFLGRLDDMPQFLSTLDHFILSSRKEGLPLSLLEAQACGVPVIATRVGASEEAVCPTSGRLVPAGDADALGHAMAQAAGDSQSQPGAIPRRFATMTGDRNAMARHYARLMGSDQ